MIYDLIIVGLGPAGITAATYAKRAGLNILCLEKSTPGGLLNKLNKIENYPGYKSIMGPELAYNFFEHLSYLNIPYKIKEVIDIKEGSIKEIITKEETYQCKNIILATGKKQKELNLNEKKYEGHGLSYCAICDADLYKDKIIAVIGNEKESIEETIYLSKIVKQVYFIYDNQNLEKTVEKLKVIHNVTVLPNSKVTKLIGETNLTSIIVNNKELEIACLFSYEGYTQNTNYIKNLNITNDKGFIEVSDSYETKIKGIYAIGDSISKSLYQIITATNEGAIAALEVAKNLKSQN